jgi:putative DNA primase/helicase
MSTWTLPRAARAAGYYTAELGWSLVEIPPGRKGPVRSGWPERGIADADAALAWWTQHARYGMGLLHGPSGTCTLDADADVELVVRALAAADVDYAALLAEPGPRIIGDPVKPPKLLYRVLTGLELRHHSLRWPTETDPQLTRGLFELRAGGVQDVLPPSVHPRTQQPYRWQHCPKTRADIPYLPRELARVWLRWEEYAPAMMAVAVGA